MYMDDIHVPSKLLLLIVTNKERYYSFDFEGDQNNISSR